MTAPSLTTLLIQRARQTSELQSYGVLTTPYVKILLRALSDRLEAAHTLVGALLEIKSAKALGSGRLRKLIIEYQALSEEPGAELPAVSDLRVLETPRPVTFEEVWRATGYQYSEDALEAVKLGWRLALEKGPSPQSPTESSRSEDDVEAADEPLRSASSPGHTDLMVTPESLDAYIGANPPAWPEVTDAWADAYCELTGKNPGGQQVTFVDGGTVTTFRDMAKREIEAMLCAAPKDVVRALAALDRVLTHSAAPPALCEDEGLAQGRKED